MRGAAVGVGERERERRVPVQNNQGEQACRTAGASSSPPTLLRWRPRRSALTLVAGCLAASIAVGRAVPPPPCHGEGDQGLAGRNGCGIRQRGLGSAPGHPQRSAVYGSAHFASPGTRMPPAAKGGQGLFDGPSRLGGTPAEPGKTKLVASVTPRQAQRQRELAASPTQLSPASPVTEDESSAVLQRVNNAVSVVHWEEQAQTPGEASGVRMKTLAGEREAVFNTPLPPGTRAAARRAPQEVAAAISSGLRSRPEYSTGLNARLYELAIRQKKQLERMLEEQQTVKAKEAEAKSAAAAPPSRVSRARMPKPIVKVSLDERSLSMGLDVKDFKDDFAARSRSREREDGVGGGKSGTYPAGMRGDSAAKACEDAVGGLVLDDDWEDDAAAADSQIEMEGQQSKHDLDVSQEVSSGDPGRFLNALDAHCEGLRTALASIEAELSANEHAPLQGELHIGSDEKLVPRQDAGQDMDEERGNEETSGAKEATVEEAEQPRHNQCFSPLPTASPSGDRLAIHSSPQLTAPAVQQLLKQHDEFLQQKQHAYNLAARGQDKAPSRRRQRQHAHGERSALCQPTSRLTRIQEIGRLASPHPAAVQHFWSIVVLAAGLMSRGLAGPGLQWPAWGTALVAAANVCAGLYLAWRSAFGAPSTSL